jgi:hypothetical protein
LWNRGAPGWIHTAYDNSTSTSALNWVEKDDLGNHIKVAALVVMRSSPNVVPEFPAGIALVLLMSVTLTVCVLVRKVRGLRIERSARASTSNLRRKILKGVWASFGSIRRFFIGTPIRQRLNRTTRTKLLHS